MWWRSKRLRKALWQLYDERFRPGPDARIFDFNADTWRKVHWRRICERSGIGARRIKDLRDSFASQLLTAGIPLGYVSTQLGHADVAVTARHCARWCGDDEWRDPIPVEAGELPTDLLAKIAVKVPSSRGGRGRPSAGLCFSSFFRRRLPQRRQHLRLHQA